MNKTFFIRHITVWAIATAFLLTGCGQKATNESQGAKDKSEQEEDQSSYQHIDWSKDDVIYELNTRQFTEEGTFKAAEKHLDRLDKMGIDIIWFMPIHPISKKNRKGKLGSPYAVTDYTQVNSNYGTMDDFKSFVKSAHNKDIHVIIDWVPNHTGWDHQWLKDHPDWYTQDSTGNVIHPEGTDWTDVADLNYGKQAMRNAMTDDMKFWLENVDIDGFRCDVAHSVPVDFWDSTVAELRKVKPIFMLAEAEIPELHEAGFDMSYGWEFHHITNEIASGDKPASAIDEYFEKKAKAFDPQDILMNFTSNHDENTWNGHVFERYGDGAKTFAVLVSTMPGMPLLYNGQEAAMDKRLEFFKEDPIEWGDYAYQDFYTKLFELKEDNPALLNGTAGGELTSLDNGAPKDVYSFVRTKGENQVVVILNLSDQKQSISIKHDDLQGDYSNLFKDAAKSLKGTIKRDLAPWEYIVYHK